jgi:acyl-[acyl-carrier-protein]-phospholipid O-acyltransferase / long-chain-fatty-acid--[acyl-carrier-protein] ligase
LVPLACYSVETKITTRRRIVARPEGSAERMVQRPFDVSRTRVTLFDALLRARDEAGGKTPILEDHDRKVLTYDDLVRAAFALGGKLKGLTSRGEAVGVLLPSGVGATVVFFALHAIGRTPVMLNFTGGAANIKGACKAARVKTVISAKKFVEAGKLEALMSELSAGLDVVYAEDIREKVHLGDKLAALVKGVFPKSFRAPGNPDDPGVILFTSGSFGAPKGAMLSHANIVANVEQVSAHVQFDPDWVFFNPLPMFHCYGLTGGTLLPLLIGRKVFLYPSPLHFKEIPQLIAECGANILFATDTFAHQYARSAKGDALKCLKFCVLGAEKVKPETRELYSRRFGVELLEGYGATEASPVIAVNQPNTQPGGENRVGTVGKLLPGIEVRLEEVPGIAEGKKLVVRGPNVMRGYLLSDGGVEELQDGWHDTGDVVNIDADGFVSIIGRVKRFAKIGGEMVSLNQVESFAAAVWPEHRHAVISLPDPRKGERLVLLSDAPDADSGKILEWAQRNGAPEIAVPKKVLKVAEIPVLGTGKTDYVSVQKLAEEALKLQDAA